MRFSIQQQSVYSIDLHKFTNSKSIANASKVLEQIEERRSKELR